MKKRDPVAYAWNARRHLAEELRSLPILSAPRSLALLSYLAVLEAEAIKVSIFSPSSPEAIFGAHRQAVESSAHAIPAIVKHCPPDEALPVKTLEPKVFDLARDLFTFTYKYDQIQYCYRLADWGHFQISVAQKDPRITFSYASPEADAADTLARAREVKAKLPGPGQDRAPCPHKQHANSTRHRLSY